MDPRAIRLDHAILHIVGDPQAGTPFSSQELPAPPATDVAVWDYLQMHIVNALEDARLRPARFGDTTQAAPVECARLLAEPHEIVSASRALARRMDAIVRANHSIAPGDLVVCLYSVADDAGDLDRTRGTRLALLKLDPGSAFRHRTVTGAHGSYVTLQPESGFLPQTGQPLQKCACVRPLQPRSPDFDVLLLDRQARPDEVALFFSDKFLGLEFVFTPYLGTKKFHELGVLAAAAAAPYLAPKDQDRFDEALAQVLRRKSFDVDRFVEDLDLPEPAQRVVVRALAPRHLPQRQITVDRAFVRELKARTRRFKGDFGLKLEVPPDFPGDHLAWKVVKPDAGRDYHEVTIKTEQWTRL